MSKGNEAVRAADTGAAPSKAQRQAAADAALAAYEETLIAGAFSGYANFVEVVSTGRGHAIVRLAEADEDYTCLDRVNDIAVTFEVVDAAGEAVAAGDLVAVR